MIAPVEYAVAVDAYLSQAPLSAASRRVYQISLAGWAWPLAGRPIPARSRRRGAAPLGAEQTGALFQLPASLREQAFWRLLYDSGAPAATVLALNANQLDLDRHQVRQPPRGTAGGQSADIAWREPAGQFLRWLLAGRTRGPVFITGRRTGTRSSRPAAGDAYLLTGQARLSYRRAAEIFTAATRQLDPAGRGWTLHQLSAAAQASS